MDDVVLITPCSNVKVLLCLVRVTAGTAKNRIFIIAGPESTSWAVAGPSACQLAQLGQCRPGPPGMPKVEVFRDQGGFALQECYRERVYAHFPTNS